jgi:hypothetical protein
MVNVRTPLGIFVLSACVGILPAEGAATQPPCTFKDPRVSTAVRWSAPFVLPATTPWSRPWKGAWGKTNFWYDKGKGQQGYFWGQLNNKGDGKGSITIEVRNGAKIAGHHFAVLVALADAQGNILHTRQLLEESRPQASARQPGRDTSVGGQLSWIRSHCPPGI